VVRVDQNESKWKDDAESRVGVIAEREDVTTALLSWFRVSLKMLGLGIILSCDIQ
jgi:hypothetical protein